MITLSMLGTAHAGKVAGISWTSVGGMQAVAVGTMITMLLNSEPPACWYGPKRNVSWKANPGYSFDVANCDYEAKKSLLTVN